MNKFSFFRLWSLVVKEFAQFKRDRTTFAMVISVPLLQIILFGLAINTNPKHLPAALVNFDQGPMSRTLVHGLQNTDYFKFNHVVDTELEANQLIKRHQVLFTLTIPPDFSRKLIRGEKPSALLEVDGTDPVSVAYAVSASNGLLPSIYQFDLVGSLHTLMPSNNVAKLIVQTKYNPSAITQYSTVPGLLGIILTNTFVIVVSMALTRERERGTLENLLTTPLLPIEVIIGKATPFIIVGYVQSALVIFIAIVPFVLASLFVGILISTLVNNQLEASQLSFLFFMPSLLLSGFAFPFYGMPIWAQWIGSVLPLTHYVNIIRGIMLKGSTFSDLWIDIWPLLVFIVVIFSVALNRYRQTLD
jgi:ABC-2 type transport system permease protein